jgi:hypothetical protein
MSAYDGGLKRSTQHVMSDARDGVDGRRVEDMFDGSTRWPRKNCGTAGGARSQFNRVARQLNERSRETLGFETRAERDLMLVLHRPIELTTQSGHKPPVVRLLNGGVSVFVSLLMLIVSSTAQAQDEPKFVAPNSRHEFWTVWRRAGAWLRHGREVHCWELEKL